ncbi:MAG: hypothetical protein ACXVPN_09375 [Bacteroidia bacterium]
MKMLTKYILPAALVAGFLFCFFSDAFNRHFSLDDYFYEGLVRRFGIAGSIEAIYNTANGRWFSHILCAYSFKFIGTGFFTYGVYLTALLILFLFSVILFYDVYNVTFLNKKLPFHQRLFFSLVFTACLYFLLFEGRWQTWGWVASANTHLMSVIISLLLFSFLLKSEARSSSAFWVILLSAFLGGLNEINAICAALMAIGILFITKKYFTEVKLNMANIFIAVIGITGSLLININSGGYKERMAGLPEFKVLQSVKNTLHSFVMPVLHYHYLAYFLGALVIFFLFIREGKIPLAKKHLVVGVFSLFIASLCFFGHCFTLSDVVPSRGAIWAYCLLLLMFSFILVPKDLTDNEPL